MTPLPDRLWKNFGKLHTWTARADQWGERGWLYDPERDELHEYEIDRKCQTDDLIRTRTPEAFEAEILPKAKKSLRDWYAALPRPG